MFISKYSVENWESDRNNGLLKEAKEWTEIESAIIELDGHQRTLVTRPPAKVRSRSQSVFSERDAART